MPIIAQNGSNVIGVRILFFSLPALSCQGAVLAQGKKSAKMLKVIRKIFLGLL
jgi:hypothetical protein